ncbi:MAG: acyltransferase family protein [Hungatella sp.]|nr:acyltransferase family protein [Hungatella sp.]
MPMFFIISGYFFRIDNRNWESKKLYLQSYIIKKFRSLLLPYIFFGLFHFIIFLGLNYPDFSLKPLYALLFENTSNLPIAGALWFLTAFFFSNIIYFLISLYIEDRKKGIVICICAILGCIATNILPFRLPYALDAALTGVGLMHIGYCIKVNCHIKEKLSGMKIYEWMILGLIAVILIFLNKPVNMRIGDYGFILLFWINAILPTLVGANVSKMIKDKFPNRIKHMLLTIGRNSIIYLCLNQVIILAFMEITQWLHLPRLLSKVFILIISMICMYGCSNLIMQTGLKKIMGK